MCDVLYATEWKEVQLQELEYFLTPELLNRDLFFLICVFEELLGCLHSTFHYAIALRKSRWSSNMLKLTLFGELLKFQTAKFRAII